jgi:hypothetical protein
MTTLDCAPFYNLFFYLSYPLGPCLREMSSRLKGMTILEFMLFRGECQRGMEVGVNRTFISDRMRECQISSKCLVKQIVFRTFIMKLCDGSPRKRT